MYKRQALLIVMGMYFDRHFLFAVGTVTCFGAALFIVVVNVILPNGNLIPVSYTHLDVYKRQGLLPFSYTPFLPVSPTGHGAVPHLFPKDTERPAGTHLLRQTAAISGLSLIHICTAALQLPV